MRVATMHRVKGLEFDAVILAGYRTPEFYARSTAKRKTQESCWTT